MKERNINTVFKKITDNSVVWKRLIIFSSVLPQRSSDQKQHWLFSCKRGQNNHRYLAAF